MLREVIAAVVDMNNSADFVVICSRFSRRGRMCIRVVEIPQNYLSPAQKEKKKCIEAAWVHSMKLVLRRPAMRKWIPVQGSQVCRPPNSAYLYLLDLLVHTVFNGNHQSY